MALGEAHLTMWAGRLCILVFLKPLVIQRSSGRDEQGSVIRQIRRLPPQHPLVESHSAFGLIKGFEVLQ